MVDPREALFLKGGETLMQPVKSTLNICATHLEHIYGVVNAEVLNQHSQYQLPVEIHSTRGYPSP